MKDCGMLQSLPESLKKLERLSILKLSECEMVRKNPEHISYCQALRRLELCSIENSSLLTRPSSSLVNLITLKI